MDDVKSSQSATDTNNSLLNNREAFDILVANIIPTSKYFEVRFDHLEKRVMRIEDDIKDFRSDMDKRFDLAKEETSKRFDLVKEETNKRFEQVDKRFEQVDKRFEQIDKRFEQVDKRFEQIIHSIDRLSDNLDKRDNVQRSFTMRMFSISIMISFIGVLGVALKLFGI